MIGERGAKGWLVWREHSYFAVLVSKLGVGDKTSPFTPHIDQDDSFFILSCWISEIVPSGGRARPLLFNSAYHNCRDDVCLVNWVKLTFLLLLLLLVLGRPTNEKIIRAARLNLLYGLSLLELSLILYRHFKKLCGIF